MNNTAPGHVIIAPSLPHARQARPSRTRSLYVAALLMLLPAALLARPPHAVYAELGGSGILYTIHYEIGIISSERHALAARIGAGYYYEGGMMVHESGDGLTPYACYQPRVSVHWLPVGVSYLLGSRKSRLELGLELTPRAFYNATWLNTTVHLVPSIGYRYQRRPRGFLFRCTIIAAVSLATARVIPWLGLSWGYAF